MSKSYFYCEECPWHGEAEDSIERCPNCGDTNLTETGTRDEEMEDFFLGKRWKSDGS